MHPRPHRQTPRQNPNQPSSDSLNVISLNIEGVKGNYAYLDSLLQKDSIVCLQEHWLWNFETDIVSELFPDYKHFIRCADSFEDKIQDLFIPRGRGVSVYCGTNLLVALSKK